LFSQSSFGIVTRMSQWLSARPDHFKLQFYDVPDDGDLGRVIDTLQALIRRGALRPTLTLYNDYRVFASTAAFPFQTSGTPLPPAERIRLRKDLGIRSTWSGDIAIYSADEAIGRATHQLVCKALGDRVVLRDAMEADAGQIDDWLDEAAVHQAAPDSAAALRRALCLSFLGTPSDDAVRSAYWRKRAVPASGRDLDRDRVGLLWCSPIVPFRGEEVTRALTLMEAIMVQYGFEPGLTVQCMTERVVYLVASISFDRDAPGDDEKALSCYHEMVATLERAGYPLYRSSVASMAGERVAAPQRDASTEAVLADLTTALDPARIIAPGRYGSAR
jgi:4-cresol dehydrogenase (hydroxylating) flavoprotein subunit